jgi:predicted Zn-dependent protease
VQWDDEAEADAAELDSLAFSTFEYLIQGRLDKYEQEADRLGMIYAARAGYDPHALTDLLGRMMGNRSNNDHYRPEIIAKRLTWARDDLQTLKYSKKKQLASDRLRDIIGQ